MPHRLQIIYDVPGWAYEHQAMAMKKYAPPAFDISLHPSDSLSVEDILRDAVPDLIFSMRVSTVPAIWRYVRDHRWPSFIVALWSVGWPNKLEVFDQTYEHCDLVIFNNIDYARRLSRYDRTSAISNGIDPDIFQVQVPVSDREAKILWTGSEYHRELKEYDQFIVPLFEQLKERGVNCEARLIDSMGEKKFSLAEMAEWYNTGTVLVCASASEGTPNPALEAAACGCTIVTTAVGNMPELIENGRNGYIVERNHEAILQGVLSASRQYRALAERMVVDIQSWDWKYRVAQYCEEFRRIMKRRS